MSFPKTWLHVCNRQTKLVDVPFGRTVPYSRNTYSSSIPLGCPRRCELSEVIFYLIHIHHAVVNLNMVTTNTFYVNARYICLYIEKLHFYTYRDMYSIARLNVYMCTWAIVTHFGPNVIKSINLLIVVNFIVGEMYSNHWKSTPLRRGCDRLVVGFTTTYAICAYHHRSVVFSESSGFRHQ